MRPVARPLSSRSEAKSSVVSRRPGAQSKGEKTAGSKQVSRENHPFDLQDLKDQVRRLRASQDDIENECDDLETKNTALELELKSLQRERITLGDSVDAKQLVEPLDEGTVKKNAEDGMGIINKDFIEANMKLEVLLFVSFVRFEYLNKNLSSHIPLDTFIRFRCLWQILNAFCLLLSKRLYDGSAW